MNAHRTLIISVFIVASCGLAYELIMAALASYLLGDSILQFSSIIGLYLFAMGIGAYLTRYIKDEDALARFIEIELLVGIVCGTGGDKLRGKNFIASITIGAPPKITAPTGWRISACWNCARTLSKSRTTRRCTTSTRFIFTAHRRRSMARMKSGNGRNAAPWNW